MATPSFPEQVQRHQDVLQRQNSLNSYESNSQVPSQFSYFQGCEQKFDSNNKEEMRRKSSRISKISNFGLQQKSGLAERKRFSQGQQDPQSLKKSKQAVELLVQSQTKTSNGPQLYQLETQEPNALADLGKLLDSKSNLAQIKEKQGRAAKNEEDDDSSEELGGLADHDAQNDRFPVNQGIQGIQGFQRFGNLSGNEDSKLIQNDVIAVMEQNYKSKVAPDLGESEGPESFHDSNGKTFQAPSLGVHNQDVNQRLQNKQNQGQISDITPQLIDSNHSLSPKIKQPKDQFSQYQDYTKQNENQNQFIQATDLNHTKGQNDAQTPQIDPNTHTAKSNKSSSIQEQNSFEGQDGEEGLPEKKVSQLQASNSESPRRRKSTLQKIKEKVMNNFGASKEKELNNGIYKQGQQFKQNALRIPSHADYESMSPECKKDNLRSSPGDPLFINDSVVKDDSKIFELQDLKELKQEKQGANNEEKVQIQMDIEQFEILINDYYNKFKQYLNDRNSDIISKDNSQSRSQLPDFNKIDHHVKQMRELYPKQKTDRPMASKLFCQLKDIQTYLENLVKANDLRSVHSLKKLERETAVDYHNNINQRLIFERRTQEIPVIYQSSELDQELYSKKLIHKFKGNQNQEVHRSIRSQPKDIQTISADSEFLYSYRNLLHLTLLNLLDFKRVFEYSQTMSRQDESQRQLSEYFTINLSMVNQQNHTFLCQSKMYNSTEILASFLQYVFQGRHFSLQLFNTMIADLFAMLTCYLKTVQAILPVAGIRYALLDQQVQSEALKLSMFNNYYRKLEKKEALKRDEFSQDNIDSYTNEYMMLYEATSCENIVVQMIQQEARGVLRQMQSLEGFLFEEMTTDKSERMSMFKRAKIADETVNQNRYVKMIYQKEDSQEGLCQRISQTFQQSEIIQEQAYD